MKYVKPRALHIGDTIGIVAPAGPMEPEKVDQAIEQFRCFGYPTRLGDCVYQSYGYLAGSDECRAADLNHMFADPTIKAIICLRGGYGSPRILDLLDYELIACNPKIFVGYSDITALHLALQSQAGLVTFHGPMVGELARSYDPLSWLVLFKQITEAKAFGTYFQPSNLFSFTITPGNAEGKLTGGNLSMIISTLGTPYEIDTRGKILFIEEVGEEPYRLDRMLTQLRLAGKLQEACGIIFTDCTDCEAAHPEKSLTWQQVLFDIIAPLGIPSYYGFKAGHSSPNLTIPLGVTARMDAEKKSLKILKPSVTESCF